MRCGNCGMKNAANRDYCTRCGSPLKLAKAPAPSKNAPRARTAATAALALFLCAGIVILALILINQRTPSVSQGDRASAPHVQQSDTRDNGNGTSNAKPIADDDTTAILVQNFIGAAYNGDWENLSPEEVAQLKPLIEKSFASIRNQPGVAGALDEVEDILGGLSNGGPTFDLIGEPKIERIGDNGVSVVVNCRMRGDDSGSMTFEDVWNLVLSKDSRITDANLSRVALTS